MKENKFSFLIAYLSLADLHLTFSEISFLFGLIGFFENALNKLDLFLFKGKYLDGFLFESEYCVKKFFTILSSKEWKLTTTNIPPLARSSVAAVNPAVSSDNSWLIKILIAWKVLVAGFIFFYYNSSLRH